MSRLKAALIREYEDDTEYDIEVYNPANTRSVELYFRGEKMAKVGIYRVLRWCTHKAA